MQAAQNLTFEKIQRQRPALNDEQLAKRQRMGKFKPWERKDKRQQDEELQAVQPVNFKRLRYQ